MTKAQAVPVTWVFESPAFSDEQLTLKTAAERAGHRCVEWRDEWWSRSASVSAAWPALAGDAVVFHGSLGNAARIAKELPWRPGAFCNVEAFLYSRLYPQIERWSVNERFCTMTVSDLAADPDLAFARLGNPMSIFVRPDSPLKPFSGRVLARGQVTLAALDFGFYYDEPTLPVVVAPARTIGREWRYVIASRRVVAGSAYTAAHRAPTVDDPGGPAWDFAAAIAAALPPPEPVYVLDVCEADRALRIVELNPWSGADLYACSAQAVVEAVSAVAREVKRSA